MISFNTPGRKVLSRDGAMQGATTGSTHQCSLAGCRGVRVTVKWSDGRITYPCSKGLDEKPDTSLQLN